MLAAPNPLSDDPLALRAEIAALRGQNDVLKADLHARDLLIQTLQAQIARLKKQKFGASSEKIEREIAQLELALEDLRLNEAEASPAANEEATAETPPEAAPEAAPEGKKARRRPAVSAQTPRERQELDPGASCPDCGGELRLVGEDVSEMLELVAAQIKVIQIARLKKSCRCCARMVQPAAPSRPIPGSMAGPGLLASVLVSKFDDHLPLYRQNEIFARMGADIPDSTLADWCAGAMRALEPLRARIEAEIMASSLLHADDTPVRVLDRSRKDEGLCKGVRQGRVWTYVRDQRPWAGTAPPGAVYYFSPDRKGEHPREHLARSSGVLQADAWSGFRELYALGPKGEAARFREAACWAHLRRDFHDVWTATKSDIAREALDRIGALYDIERQISGQPPDQRHAARQQHSAPRVADFHEWAKAQLTRISGKSELAKAFRYALNRWPSFALFLGDGRIAIDNNAAERALRPIAVGRHNWLFVGSDAGGRTLARAMTLIETAKINGLDPLAWLTDVLARIHDHPNRRLDELLPWNWRKTPENPP